MKFSPEYVTYVLNENFEDAKALLLSPIVSANTLRWSPETRLSMPEKATQTAFS